MKIILASSNKGKIKQIEKLLPDYEVIPYSLILGSFEIVEDGDSFKANAIIKAKTIVEKLKEIDYKEDYIVISDDSGITVPELNNEPNIYSARYAGPNATDKQNNQKLISKLKEKGIKKTTAFYTACIAIGYKENIYTTHGWMYGEVIDTEIGEGGFGYDPLFIPDGFNDTLGVLEHSVKKDISHRAKALKLAMMIIKSVTK
ncbi:MAG: non-canonical purine NTP pyrophosphatase [Campylobacterota bacterium]|nr:non-canonical purine NTP pyrophosphatase [Campylobacterota bacterium]